MKFLLVILAITDLANGLTVGKEGLFEDNWTKYDSTTTSFSAQQSYYAKRPGAATNTHSCDQIRNQVPRHLTFITRYRFYQKYTEAYGIPVVSSGSVSDKALRRACHITRFLFADRYDLRNSFYKNEGRFAVIAIREQTTTIPEFSHLPAWWNQRARGLGGVLGRPISCGGEENVLCLRQDRYYGDDIFFHEAAHGVAEVGMAGGLQSMYQRLKGLYNSARRSGKWRNTYAMTDSREYFAEGLQSYFNNHIEGPNPPNGVHGPINTRAELRSYDPGLYNLIKELYPCGNTYHWCKENAAGSNLRMNCDGTGPIITQAPQTKAPTDAPKPQTTEDLIPPIPVTTQAPPSCKDHNRYCAAWSKYGYCDSNGYVKKYCKLSCNTC